MLENIFLKTFFVFRFITLQITKHMLYELINNKISLLPIFIFMLASNNIFAHKLHFKITFMKIHLILINDRNFNMINLI